MKFHPLIAVAVLALAVAACHDEPATPTPPDDVVTVPDETPPPPRDERDNCGRTGPNTACP